MKFFAILILVINFSEVLADGAAMSAMIGMSAADSVDRITSRKKKGIFSKIFSDNDLPLEEVMIVTEADMNNRGAMKAHLVIVYDRELLRELSSMSSYRYFEMVDQLIKDHPDRMKIYSWDLIAEDRIGKWQKIDTLKDTMSPIGGLVFANYNDNIGQHRARIPNYEKVKITFKRNDFEIDYEDKNLDDDGNEDASDVENEENDDDSGFSLF